MKKSGAVFCWRKKQNGFLWTAVYVLCRPERSADRVGEKTRSALQVFIYGSVGYARHEV